MDNLKRWFRTNFSDPQVVILVAILAGGIILVVFLGRILAPILASIVIAYLLEGPVGALEKRKLPRIVAVSVVFAAFIAAFLGVLIAVVPLLFRQSILFLQKLPEVYTEGQRLLLRLPERYPQLFSEQQIRELIALSRTQLLELAQDAVTSSLTSLASIAMILVYLVLVPFLVFFFLKDKELIAGWLRRFIPKNYELSARVWRELDRQLGNFLRGKSWEILIVWGATSPAFAFLGLQFSVLMGFLVGLSVLVPYAGVTAMAIPVGVVAYSQWGFTAHLFYVMIAYTVIQLIDGNLLAPLLFSEVVELHPVAIISAVLIFGGLGGFWGLFFAIPLAALAKAILDAWPRIVATSEAVTGDDAGHRSEQG